MLDEIVDNECVISFIVEIELQVWDPPNPEDLHVYKSFLSDSIIIGVDSDIIREAIRVRKLILESIESYKSWPTWAYSTN